MGSVRSSSTTYSSGGGFFSRNRHNSVYSSPETGGLPQTNNPNLKMSLYDRLVGRKSIRSQRMGRQGKCSLPLVQSDKNNRIKKKKRKYKKRKILRVNAIKTRLFAIVRSTGVSFEITFIVTTIDDRFRCYLNGNDAILRNTRTYAC